MANPPELLINLMICSPLGNFKREEIRLAYESSFFFSLRAINKSKFSLMGTQRKSETKQIYG